MLLVHRWKRSLQLGTCNGDANASTSHKENNCLFANRLLFASKEGDEATSPSFATRYALIKDTSSSLERSWQLGTCNGDANASTLPTANKCLFANVLHFAIGEGDEATLPSFAMFYVPIEAASALLEMFIATWYMQWGYNWEHFTHNKHMPIYLFFTFYEQRGRRGNVAFFYNVFCTNWGCQRIAGNVHCNLVHAVRMQPGALYPRRTNTCLPIFNCLGAETVTKQCCPLLQLWTRQFMLLAHCWKHSLQLVTCRRDSTGAFCQWQMITYWPTSSFLWVKMETGHCLLRFWLQTRQWALPERCWKRSLHVYCPQVALPKRPLFPQKSSSWLLSDRCLLALMVIGQGSHLACRLAFKMHFCRRAFIAQWMWRVFLTLGILIFPGERQPHYSVLLAGIFSLPSIQTIPPGRTIFW